jgi:hypothetical protein
MGLQSLTPKIPIFGGLFRIFDPHPAPPPRGRGATGRRRRGSTGGVFQWLVARKGHGPPPQRCQGITQPSNPPTHVGAYLGAYLSVRPGGFVTTEPRYRAQGIALRGPAGALLQGGRGQDVGGGVHPQFF